MEKVNVEYNYIDSEELTCGCSDDFCHPETCGCSCHG